MRIADFDLERYFARWEFAVRHLLCASDVEGWPMRELLALADDETAALWGDLRLGYTESPGHPLLRREIAGLYETTTADDILVLSGAEEGIFAIVNVLLGPGDHAIVTWPGYQSLYEVARGCGADVTLHELREADGWAIDVEALRHQVTTRTRLIVINAPHNPTGMLPDRATFDAVVAIAAEAGARLLVDEVYRYLEFDEGDRLPAGVDAGRHVVSLGVMSKSFAMAGLRIGWLASRDPELLARVAAFKDYTTICASAPSEILALVGLRARDRVLARSRAIVLNNLARLDALFERWPGALSWIRPRGGSIGFPRLRPDLAIDRFSADLVETEGVLLLPGTRFGHDGNHFRIGFGRTDLPEAVAGLERHLERVAR
ncbi:MAG TPA: aminotransferase class I/II-fold pyridoxal phosphate-dependent enzyme [Candidatus Sulfomarinibacteraceae bacterium]|nr:aminotransferase class I/II-fold pyridoxal phosphate-dependent enzyme [Candidatus Sulfomarinibacteraceae bacterium]